MWVRRIARELREHNRAVVAQFLELLDVLLADPNPDDHDAVEPRVKIEQLRSHFEAMHTLIGKARPHQAREEFIAAQRTDVARRELTVYEMRSARLRTELLVSDRAKSEPSAPAEQHAWLPDHAS